MAPRAKKEKPPPQPDDLVRESAGSYRTGDGRFEVQRSDVGWYLVDSQQTNEFGQQLIHGPFPTLEAIRDAIPGTREIAPLLRVKPAKAKTTAAKGEKNAQPAAPPPPPPPPPPSWIDQLSQREGVQVRSLIRVLQKEGLPDAEQEVRRHRDKPSLIAARLVEERLRSLVADQPAGERERALELVREVVDILATQGATVPRPAPRWALVEVGNDEDVPTNRIRPDV